MSSEIGKAAFATLSTMVEYIPSALLRAHVNAQIALRFLRRNDKHNFDILMREQVIAPLRNAPPSELRDSVINDTGIALFEYSPTEAKTLIGSLPYEYASNAWGLIVYRLLANANIGDPLDEDPPNAVIDIQCANKVLEVLSNIDIDFVLYDAAKAFALSVSDPDNTLLSEQLQLDILERLDIMVEKKLPDRKNIQHDGYLLVSKSAIELARWRAAKRAKGRLKRKHPQLIKALQSVPNVADRVFIMSLLGEDLRLTKKEQGEQLVTAAMALAVQIPNVRDRINRLEHIADAFGKLRETGKGKEAINMAMELSANLAGVERDQVLAAIVQTVHELDPELASQLTERIDNPWERLSADRQIKALELAKLPQRIDDVKGSLGSEEIISDASDNMMSKLISGRSVVHSASVLLEWVSAVNSLHFSQGLAVANWAVESVMRQSSRTEVAMTATALLNHVLWCNNLLFELGNRLGFLSHIPDGIREGFQGLSNRITIFRVGEREKAISWIRNWLKENAREYVKICDPYFEPQQLWIVQSIPTSTNVIIVLSLYSGDFRSATAKQIADEYNRAWEERCEQEPPPTVLFIHATTEEDKYHDRFVTTTGGGLQIGTSLNGMGKSEFTISLLNTEDAKYVEQTYIDPKLDLQRNLGNSVFFRLRGQ